MSSNTYPSPCGHYLRDLTEPTDRAEEVRPGLWFDAQFHGDGSAGARASTGKNVSYVFNERLGMQRQDPYYKRTGRVTPRGGTHRFTAPAVCPMARKLEFRADGGHGSVASRFYITGDLERAHYPQAWARGLRPIMSADRVRQWCDGGDGTVLFYSPNAFDIEEIAAYCALLAHEWRGVYNRVRVQDYNALLQGLGYTGGVRVLRRALARAVEKGFLKRERVTATWWEYPAHHTEGYHRWALDVFERRNAA